MDDQSVTRPLLTVVRGNAPKREAPLGVCTIGNGARVVRVPCADGSVKLIGVVNDRWVAAWSCLEDDFEEEMIDRLLAHVRASKVAATAVQIPELNVT